MKDYLPTLIKVILAFVLVGTFVNDLATVAITHYNAQNSADTIAESFAKEYGKTNSATVAKYKADIAANDMGVKIVKYEILPTEVDVTISVPVKSTIYISRIKYLSQFAYAEATGTSTIVAR